MAKGRRRSRRFNGCRDKARYATWDEAHAAQPAQHAYPCAACQCFHLSSAVVGL